MLQARFDLTSDALSRRRLGAPCGLRCEYADLARFRPIRQSDQHSPLPPAGISLPMVDALRTLLLAPTPEMREMINLVRFPTNLPRPLATET